MCSSDLDFIRLNQQWIETWFRLEQSDLDTFAHIDDCIIGHGGQIFLAIDDSGQVITKVKLRLKSTHKSSFVRKSHLEPL